MHGLTIDGDLFKILKNEEEQYSLWPSEKKTPEGWQEVGITGSASECTAWVDENWKDMRPRSLREKMDK
jgi:MbtH protein